MIRDFFVPSNEDAGSPFLLPEVEDENFEFRSNMIQWVQQACSFHGLLSEYPNDHVRTFVRICNALKIRGLTADDIKLRIFPFTLMDRAQTWLNSLPDNSIDSWNTMRQAFLSEYFPPSKVAQLQQAIINFQQHSTENPCEAWKRFKELLKKCPQHGIGEQMQMTVFYNGLLPDARATLDASSGGTFMMKTVRGGRQLLDDMASNYVKWQPEPRVIQKKAGVFEVNEATLLQAQIAALTKQVADVKAPKVENCEICSGNHKAENCNATLESVQYVKNQGNYGNYNNFGNQWKGQSSNSWNPQ